MTGADHRGPAGRGRPLVWALLALVVAVLVIWTLPSLLTRAPRVTGAERHTAEAAVRAALIALLVACGTAVSVVYTARTFRLTTLGHLVQRFQQASAQLGSEKASVRVAGIQALAQLADEWGEQRQSCISVICAHLRAVDNDAAPVATRYERRAGLDLLRDRLGPAPRVSWAGCDLDLSGIVLDDVDLSGIVLRSGRVSFRAAVFAGSVDLAHARVEGAEVTFRGATFERASHVRFDGAQFVAGSVSMEETCFRGGEVVFRGAEFRTGCTVTFAGAELGFGGTVDFGGATIEGRNATATAGGLSFAGARFGGENAVDETVRFDGADFTRVVSFEGAQFQRAVSFAEVSLQGATLLLTGLRVERGGALRFTGARAAGARVVLTDAKSLGGRIDMTRLADGPPQIEGEAGRLVELGTPAPSSAPRLDGP